MSTAECRSKRRKKFHRACRRAISRVADFLCLASASQMAVSSAALAMLCPRTRASRSNTSEAELNSLPFSDGPEKIADDVPRSFDRFVGVVGVFAGRAFAPAGTAIHVHFNEQNATQRSAAEAGFKWRDQRHMDFAQSDFAQAHVGCGLWAFGLKSRSFSLRILPGDILADAGPRWKRQVPECNPCFAARLEAGRDVSLMKQFLELLARLAFACERPLRGLSL